MKRKQREDADAPNDSSAFIRNTCNHPLLSATELNALIFTAHRGKWAHSFLITRNLHTLISFCKKEHVPLSDGVRLLTKSMDALIKKGSSPTTTRLKKMLYESLAESSDEKGWSEQRIHDIDCVIAEVLPLKRIPKTYAHYENIEEAIALVVAALPGPKGPRLTESDEYALRVKFIEKLRAHHSNAKDVQRVITRTIRSFTPQNSRQTAKLVKDVRAGYIAANEIVRCNGRLATKLAKMYRWSGMHLEDSIIAAQCGIMKALYRFEPARGLAFSTYASWWMRHAISRIKSNEGRIIRVPVHREDTLNRLRKLELGAETTSLTDDEVACRLGIDTKVLKDIRPHINPTTSIQSAPADEL